MSSTSLKEYNKTWAVAVVIVLHYILQFTGIELPVEVQLALAALLVFFVPNKHQVRFEKNVESDV